MIVTTNYAEEKLLAMCSKLKIDPKAWRVLHFIPAVGTTARDEVRWQLAVNTIRDVVDGDQYHVFFLQAGDFVFLARGISAHALHSITENLKRSFPAMTGTPSDAQIYDLSVHFGAFQDFAEARCLQAHEAAVAAQKTGHTPEPREIKVDMAYAQKILAARSNRRDVHIQLVEDDLFTLQLVSGVLKDHTLIKTMDGLDAVETYYLNAPDIVFLDLNLPSMNGQQVLQKIIGFDPDAFVVMLTGNSVMREVTQAIKTGARGYVTKPFPKEKLLNYVKIYQSERRPN